MFAQHPVGLRLLFFTETWERFSYYGMRALLSLFMINALLFDKAFTSQIYGIYTAAVYMTPIIGGYISDRYWGNRRSIIVGAILMALGQFGLFISGTFYSTADVAIPFFAIGLTLLVIGNGFFKPNISTMVGTLYPEGDRRRDSAYTIFYMGVNLGAFLSPLVCGYLGDTGSASDFRWGFFAAGIGMLIGLFTFITMKDKYLVTPTGEQIGLAPSGKSQTEKEKYDKPLTSIDYQRIAVIFILAFFVVFFWASFEQAGISLTFFAEEQTIRDFNVVGIDFVVPASWFQSINPLMILLLAPFFAWLWIKLGDRGMEPSSPVKMSIGIFLLSVGYLIIIYGISQAEGGAKVSAFWLFALYTVHTMGELCLSPIGLSMVNKLAPLKFASLLMGVWFLANMAANYTAGFLSSFYPDPKAGHFPELFGFVIGDLQAFFMIFVIMSATAAAILFVLSFWLKQLMHGVH